MAIDLQRIVDLALQLTPCERLQLVEHMVASVEKTLPVEETPPFVEQSWGEQLARLLNESGPAEMSHSDIEDPVEWVKQIRQDNAEWLNPYGDNEA